MIAKRDNPAVGFREIAAACNVSLMTVSRAFRANSAIRPETRAAVIQKAEELGYLRVARKGRPPIAAVQPVSTGQIQLIFGNSGGNMYYFHTRLLTAVEQQLAEAGFECIIRTCSGNFGAFVRLLERVRLDHSLATIILGSFQSEQLEQLLPLSPGALLLDNYVRPAFQGACSTFSFDNRLAAYQGVAHLAQTGRQRILLLAGPPEHFFSSELLLGYRDALSDHGLEFREDLVIHADFSASGAASALRRALSKGLEFDAVFTNDEMATGAYHVLQENKIAIPAQVAVCGCDNLPVGEQLYPELSTISLDYHELAVCAVQHIVSGKSSSVFLDIKLPPTLLVKKST